MIGAGFIKVEIFWYYYGSRESLFCYVRLGLWINDKVGDFSGLLGSI